ncbi:MAG: ABC transporter ATP-binding protein, partial [Alistipes sp.]|nr:ABC transporter ATP-binding protein [Alistipes sp.]
SLGNRKKFFIAFALACNVKLLIFDEPTNGLDILGKKVFRQLLAAEINDERTIIVSTHLVSDLESLISDVIVIKDHNIVLNADVNTISERLEFGNANAITTPIYKDGLRAIGKGDGEPTNVDLEMLYLALHDNSVNQQIIDLVSGKEELC